MSEIKMDTKKANNSRGAAGFAGLLSVWFGATIQWGFGAGIFSAGVVLVVITVTDELAERFTKVAIKRTGDN